MKVWFRTPYSTEKNLGKAYNEEMKLIPDGDAACFTDGDTCFLSPDYGHLITKYANQYPTAVLTCWTNRIHTLASGQNKDNPSPNITDHLSYPQEVSTVTRLEGPVSGFLMVVPKSVWKEHRFTEFNKYNPDQPNLLGVDNEWTNRIRAHGVKILRMDGIYIWHTYRILSNGKDKTHLL